jgi:ribonuclease P protein component
VLVAHLLIRASEDLSPSGAAGRGRVGLVVSKAVGPAVTRNRVKRRLRHLARERVDRLPQGALLVLRALPPAAQASYADLGAELDRCLRGCLSAPGRRTQREHVGASA